MGEKEQGKAEVYIGISENDDKTKGGWGLVIKCGASGYEKGTVEEQGVYAMLNALQTVGNKSFQVKIFTNRDSIVEGMKKNGNHKENKELWEQVEKEKEKFSSNGVSCEYLSKDKHPDMEKAYQMACEQRDNA